MKFPIIADSGANYHMFKELEFFENLIPALAMEKHLFLYKVWVL